MLIYKKGEKNRAIYEERKRKAEAKETDGSLLEEYVKDDWVYPVNLTEAGRLLHPWWARCKRAKCDRRLGWSVCLGGRMQQNPGVPNYTRDSKSGMRSGSGEPRGSEWEIEHEGRNPVESGTLTGSGVWKERHGKPFKAQPLGALQTIHLVW